MVREAGIFQKLPEKWLSHSLLKMYLSPSVLQCLMFNCFLIWSCLLLLLRFPWNLSNCLSCLLWCPLCCFILSIFIIYIYSYVYYNAETLGRMGEPGTFPAAKWQDFDHCILTMILNTPSNSDHLKLKLTDKRKQRKQKGKQESKTIWSIAFKTWSFWKPSLE